MSKQLDYAISSPIETRSRIASRLVFGCRIQAACILAPFMVKLRAALEPNLKK